MNDDEQLRGLFGEMREEPVPGDSLARVRMNVAERVEARRRRVGMGWRIAAVLAVCGGLAAVFVGPGTVAPVQAPAVLVPAPAGLVKAPAAAEEAVPVLAPELAPESAPVKARPVVRKVVHRKLPPAPIEGGANEIRIESPLEPDVVIVLIGG